MTAQDLHQSWIDQSNTEKVNSIETGNKLVKVGFFGDASALGVGFSVGLAVAGGAAGGTAGASSATQRRDLCRPTSVANEAFEIRHHSSSFRNALEKLRLWHQHLPSTKLRSTGPIGY